MYNPFENDDWNFLIVLDACRFDFFSYFYKNYFTGTLTKHFSLGACTTEWFINSFQRNYKDTVYISANPYINSIHSETGLNVKKRFFQINAKKKFYKVIDVWNFGWNDKLGTVHPKSLTDTTLSMIKKYPKKRFIIHYLQPHAPYLSNKYFAKGFPKPNIYTGEILSGVLNVNPKLQLLLRSFSFILNKLFFNRFGNIFNDRLREFLHFPPASPLAMIVRMYGLNGLRKAYADNLNIVLNHVSFLASKLSGNIIITSDHGEFLGEDRRFGHPRGSNHPIVRDVPWFKITKIKQFNQKEELRYKISNLKLKGHFQ